MPEAQHVVLHGKGVRQRMVYPAAGAVAALDDWRAIRGDWPGPLFVPVTKGGKIGRRALNPQTVYDILARRTAAAWVDHLSPHDLRRTFAGDLLDAGADLSVTQKLLGHASPATSARYDWRGARAARALVGPPARPLRAPSDALRRVSQCLTGVLT